jgi:hypothetical protein
MEPLILFGAFDRHNLGDLLLARLAEREAAPRPVVFAGLAERDLTPFGGPRVRAIDALARDWGARRADVLHVGGELLACTRAEADIMLLPPEVARATLAGRGAGLPDDRPAYLVAKSLFRNPGSFEHRALGGVNLARLPLPYQREVIARLSESSALTVRDHATQAWLAGQGLDARLEPDPAVRVCERFGSDIDLHRARGEPARVRERFSHGYLGVQFAADFGDDRMLDSLAHSLRGKPLVLFRAGCAPWHDDLEVYRRLAARLDAHDVHVFESPHLWDICALIAGARTCIASSLHARIVARAYNVSALSLAGPDAVRNAKLAAWIETWETGAMGPAPYPGYGAEQVPAEPPLTKLRTSPPSPHKLPLK